MSQEPVTANEMRASSVDPDHARDLSSFFNKQGRTNAPQTSNTTVLRDPRSNHTHRKLIAPEAKRSQPPPAPFSRKTPDKHHGLKASSSQNFYQLAPEALGPNSPLNDSEVAIPFPPAAMGKTGAIANRIQKRAKGHDKTLDSSDSQSNISLDKATA